MGVLGFTRVLREQGYLPDTSPCCSLSQWHDSSSSLTGNAHLEVIPSGSHLLVDGNGLVFHWYRVAYARHVASVVAQQQRGGSSSNRRTTPLRSPGGSHRGSTCLKVKSSSSSNNNHANPLLTPTVVRRLLPTFLPQSQVSAVVHEFVTTLTETHGLQLTVYWDGPRRRTFKAATDADRRLQRPDEWAHLQDYCATGSLPATATTVCAWEAALPKNRLFQAQVRHTLSKLHVTMIECEEEADVQLARDAQGQVNTFVLGQDTDFCFFDNLQYIPYTTLAAAGRQVTSVVLRRATLADALALPHDSLLVELAILLGNDYIRPSSSAASNLGLDYGGKLGLEEICDFLRQQTPDYRVTSSLPEVEESLRFIRSLYGLACLDDFPFGNEEEPVDPEEDEAGDEVTHLQSRGHFAIPPEVPLELCKVHFFVDATAKDAVVRCLSAYVAKNLVNSMFTPEHLAVFEKMPLDSSGAQLVQTGDWRPDWADMGAAYLVENLVAHVCKTRSVVAQLLPPFCIFDQHKFHALLRVGRESNVALGLPPKGKPSRRVKAAKKPKKPAAGAGPYAVANGQVKTPPAPAVKDVLPIDEHEEQILASILKNRVTIIQGETGCGKSSRIPVMIMRAPAPDPAVRKVKLYMSQPRRIAAKGLVERVRQVEPDLRDQIALRMGHGVREYETKKTRAWFVTTGYLVRLMANNMQSLKGVSHLIIDEVHERSVDTDILCLLCRRLLYTNDHVRLVLMSATMAANLYQEYFGAPEPPLVVGAKRYPVTEVFLEDLVSQQSTCKLSAKAKKTALQTLDECNKMKCIRTPSLSYMEKLFTIVTSLVATIAETGSSILIFVPGMNEIIGISELIEQQFVPGKRFTCIPVHSDIPFEDQMKVFDHAEPDECRVIIATNSAESSVTLPALNHVICLGLAKQITYNELSHRQMLEPVWISRASATQRAGRTGRIAPGTVFRLYSRECYTTHMQPFEAGEMLRTPLDSVILTLKEMMGDDEKVSTVLGDCIEPPNLSTIERSYESLHHSHFITSPDDDCHMTTLGEFALALGIDLSLGSLIGLGIQFGVGREAIQMASIFSFPKTPWQIPNPMIQESSEFNAMSVKAYTSKCDFDANIFSEPLAIMNLLWDFNKINVKKQDWCYKKGVSYQRISRLASTVDSVARRVANFFDLPASKLQVECAPRDMPNAKITLLRVVQTWVFHDTMIECKIKNQNKASADVQVRLLPKSDPVDESTLGTIFVKGRHDFSLFDPKEIEQRMNCDIEMDPSSRVFSDRTERRALSYAVEKKYSLFWTWVGSAFSIYLSPDVISCSDFAVNLQQMKQRLDGPVTLKAESVQGSKRGVEERPCGLWTFSIVKRVSDGHCFQRFTSTNLPKKDKNRLASHCSKFVASSPRFSSFSIDLSKPTGKKASGTTVVIVSRGNNAREMGVQDAKDVVGAVGPVDAQKARVKSGTPTINFPSRSRDGTSDTTNGRKPMMENIPEAARLLSVMASRRRSHFVSLEVELADDGEIDFGEESDGQIDIYPDPKATKLSYRWTRFNSDDRVFIEENSPVASCVPVGWSGTMYCCCANALEIKGGTLRADGLTLLPLGRVFFMLSRVSFGLLQVSFDDDDALQQCIGWIAQDEGSFLPDDIVRRLQAAASLHRTFDAGEELVCLPSKVQSLLSVFDGLEGDQATMWSSFTEDPFSREDQKDRNAKF